MIRRQISELMILPPVANMTGHQTTSNSVHKWPKCSVSTLLPVYPHPEFVDLFRLRVPQRGTPSIPIVIRPQLTELSVLSPTDIVTPYPIWWRTLVSGQQISSKSVHIWPSMAPPKLFGVLSLSNLSIFFISGCPTCRKTSIPSQIRNPTLINQVSGFIAHRKYDLISGEIEAEVILRIGLTVF